LSNAATEISVSSVRDSKKGDVVYVYNPAATSDVYVGVVWDIDVANKKLKVLPAVSGLGIPIPSGSPIACSTAHRLVTTSEEALVNGATSLRVTTTFNLNIGARVIVTDGTTLTDVQVTGIDGNRIRFAAVTLGAPIATGAVVASQEFNLNVYEKGVLKEVISNLSMEEDNALDYVEVRLAGETNESITIVATDLLATPTDDWKKIPLPVDSIALAGGTNGSTPTDSDFIGSDIDPKSGMYLLDNVSELNFFAIPGITAVSVQKEMVSFAESKANIIAVLDAPLVADQATEVINYRQFDLNADSSFAALYYPWLIVRDPVVGNQRIAIPPSGHVCGAYAEVGAVRGVHVAPANVSLRSVLDLTHYTSDGEQDLLNPIGINAIRSFPGEGIRIWGARTLFSYQDGRHYVPVRRLLNFVKESVRQGNRFAVFEPIDPRLFDIIERVNEEFLRSLWLRGQLYPSNDVTRAFFVKCDEETNPQSEVRGGRVTCEIGINPPIPAEFVIFRIGLWDGGSTIEEEIARRG